MPARGRFALVYAAAITVAGCGGGASPSSATPAPETMPLASIVGQALIVAPLQVVQWPAGFTGTGAPATGAARDSLDAAVRDTLRHRVNNPAWVFADAVVKAAANNPTYATDPRRLSINPLRAASLKVADPLPEPLASQLRTLIALQDGRLVLLPVELKLTPLPDGAFRPVVRLVLVDPRMSVVRWIGEAAGADTRQLTPQLYASIATRMADLFVPR